MPETIVDLGKKIKAKFPGQYDDLADDELGRRTKAKFPGSYDDFADTPKPPTSLSQKLGIENPIAAAPLDFVEGVGAGVLSTAGNLLKLGGKVMPPVGVSPEARAALDRRIESLSTPPDSLAGKAGKFVEQAAEFAIPVGAASKAAKAAGLRLPARAALEGVSSGAVAGIQSGGDPGATAEATVLGGALPIAGKAIPPVARGLQNSARAQYGRVLNATKQGNKFLSQKVVPRLIDEGVTALTMKGLNAKVTRNVQRLGQAIGDEFDNLPSGSAIELDPILQRIQQSAEDAYTVVTSGGRVPKGPLAETGIGHVDSLKDALASVAEVNPATGAREIPVDRLRSVRQYFDSIAAKAGRYEGKALADESMAEAHGMAADGIRNELAQAYPNIDRLNKDFNFWKNVSKVVGDTMMRREGQAKPLSHKMAKAAGSAAGFVSHGPTGLVLGRYGAGLLEQITASPAWGTVSAVAKDKLAKALARGRRGDSEFLIKKIARGIGGTAITPSQSVTVRSPAMGLQEAAQADTAPKPEKTYTVTDPDGVVHTFTSPGGAAAFKKGMEVLMKRSMEATTD
ncbi:MAG: hypothetical protein LLG20_18560 [Acidobacteriales bacterium]|nr:hypothetical protein [Terriglobales bacterium]